MLISPCSSLFLSLELWLDMCSTITLNFISLNHLQFYIFLSLHTVNILGRFSRVCLRYQFLICWLSLHWIFHLNYYFFKFWKMIFGYFHSCLCYFEVIFFSFFFKNTYFNSLNPKFLLWSSWKSNSAVCHFCLFSFLVAYLSVCVLVLVSELIFSETFFVGFWKAWVQGECL